MLFCYFMWDLVVSHEHKYFWSWGVQHISWRKRLTNVLTVDITMTRITLWCFCVLKWHWWVTIILLFLSRSRISHSIFVEAKISLPDQVIASLARALALSPQRHVSSHPWFGSWHLGLRCPLSIALKIPWWSTEPPPRKPQLFLFCL